MRFSITEIPDTDAHKRTNNEARAKWRKSNPAATRYDNVPTTFICIDGEGITLPDGSHRYVLLGCGDAQVSNPDGLSFTDCLEFLWSQFRTGSVAYTGFFLSYDFIQWFRSLPEERARMLLTADGRAKRKPKNPDRIQPFPVEYDGWEFDILGNKRFRFRKAGTDRWMSICDTGPFFQKSFLKVIDPSEWSDPVVSQEEFDEITRGKARRGTASLDSDMLHYNARENAILARIMCRLNEGFQSLGIHLRPSQWFGPGQAAQAWLDGRAITGKRLQEITPAGALEAARMSYFGGWFEIMAHGIIPGNTYEYDINSAYPYIISTLPCLEHGEWIHYASNYTWRDPNRTGNMGHNRMATRNEEITSEANTLLSLVYAKVRGRDRYIGSMLHRDAHGNICRPDRSEGWYWQDELDTAVAAGIVHGSYDVSDRWVYVPCDCDFPFREVRDIYALRQQVGKKTPLGIACKLVPNSLYGKFAQSIGNPKYGNPVYASRITSRCRTMILNAIATHPRKTKDVLMVATDGIYFSTPHPGLDVSNRLGAWDSAVKSNMTLFKPGVYWDDSTRRQIAAGDSPVFKARGVNARDFASQLAEVDRQFKMMATPKPRSPVTGYWWPEVEFPLEFAMVTAVQALARGKWELAGTLVPDPTAKQSSNPYAKRCNPGWEGRILRTSPLRNDPYEPSRPYGKRFGLEDPYSDESGEMAGITPDGVPMMAIREILGL